jgi:methyl-accepting chemotaxis protein
MNRKHFIIKPRLQIKYMLISFLVVCVTAMAVYYVFWSSLVRAAGMDQLSGGEMSALHHAYNVSFVWVVVILGAAIGVESIFFFHRLIGPIFVLEHIIKSIAAGNFNVSMHLRKHDELKDTELRMQEMIANIRTAVRDDRARIEEIRALLGQGKISQVSDALTAIGRWYKLD